MAKKKQSKSQKAKREKKQTKRKEKIRELIKKIKKADLDPNNALPFHCPKHLTTKELARINSARRDGLVTPCGKNILLLPKQLKPDC